jgi:hypothetical protein
MSISPHSVFRNNGDPLSHGCVHLMALKGVSANVIPGTPAYKASQKITAELLLSYKMCVRYSLSFRNKRHFIGHPKHRFAKEIDAVLKVIKVIPLLI